MQKFVLLLAASLTIFITGTFLIGRISNSNPTPIQPSNSNNREYFHSNTLKFSVEVLPEYQVEEKNTYIDLKSGNLKINISRNGTNFEKISDYLESFDKKRMIVISSEEKVKILSYDSVKRIEVFKAGPITEQKVYFIYVDNWVYAISTSSEELYSDLDQIAQSFRYTP